MPPPPSLWLFTSHSIEFFCFQFVYKRLQMIFGFIENNNFSVRIECAAQLLFSFSHFQFYLIRLLRFTKITFHKENIYLTDFLTFSLEFTDSNVILLRRHFTPPSIFLGDHISFLYHSSDCNIFKIIFILFLKP